MNADEPKEEGSRQDAKSAKFGGLRAEGGSRRGGTEGVERFQEICVYEYVYEYEYEYGGVLRRAVRWGCAGARGVG